jgi:hypothetical protein
MENMAYYPSFSEGEHYAAVASFSGKPSPDDVMAVENSHVQGQIWDYLLESDQDDSGMTLCGLQKLAKSSGVKAPETMTLKIELVRAIQMATYHQPCFGSELRSTCTKEDCNWRYECKRPVTQPYGSYV